MDKSQVGFKDTDEDFTLTLDMVDQPGPKQFQCHSGMRRKWALYGLNWPLFLHQGISFKQLLDLNDAQINRCLHEVLKNGRKE